MTPYPTRTDEPSEQDDDGCFSEPCPEPRQHPVHASMLESYPKGFMLICPHDCPEDNHGQRHYIEPEPFTTEAGGNDQ